MAPQRLLPSIDGQQRIDPDLISGQIDKPLCPHVQTTAQEQHAQHYNLANIHKIITYAHADLLYRGGLLAVKREHFAFLEPAFQMVVDMNRTHTSWRARIEQIARLQGKELRDIGDNLIHRVEHV